MSDRIALALGKLFERHRIVFWYDAKQELRQEFHQLHLPDIEKVEIGNDEFGLKHRILRGEPDHRFLLYHHGPRPADLDNWLLDVLLAHGEFRTDQGALWLAELELDQAFLPVIEEHADFFQATKRREALKKLIGGSDSPGQVRLKMLAVCAGSEPRLDAILENLLADLPALDEDPSSGADDGGRPSERMRLCERSGLDRELWKQLDVHFGYVSATPGLRDFVLSLFKSCHALGTGRQPHLTGDAVAFIKRWKDSRQHQAVFERHSGESADLLDIEADLDRRDFRDLMEHDLFRLVDLKIISDLTRGLVQRTLARNEVLTWVRQRRASHWYDEFRDMYLALEHGALFLQALEETDLVVTSMADGIERYTRTWFRLDQTYRKFTLHAARAGQASLLGSLIEQVEGLYANRCLLTLGDRWQECVNSASTWNAYPVPLQRRFFAEHVQGFRERNTKVAVIISDALRYEIADELQTLIRQEDRYQAELTAMLSVLPSYTQLGMAALLPNRALQISDQETGTVLVDGQPSQGLVNRDKILFQGLDGRGKAVRFDDVMPLDRDASRDLVRDVDVLYVYHNRIDATGDKRDTEKQVFEAVEHTLEDLIRLVKKLAGANISHVLITADHGFLYQHRELEESDFADIPVQGQPLLLRNRRFVLGKGLRAHASLVHFTASDLDLAGDVEVQIPRSVHRLRVQGSGSRFVHGGATLQEVVVPVLHVSKKRQSDTSQVEVEILRGASSVITTGQLAVTLFQGQPVSDKVHPRTLRIGIYDRSGELISNCHDLIFDRDSDNPRDREMLVRLVLTSKADASNGKEVVLKLEEKVQGTTHYREYRTVGYTMRKSFSQDFDL